MTFWNFGKPAEKISRLVLINIHEQIDDVMESQFHTHLSFKNDTFSFFSYETIMLTLIIIIIITWCLYSAYHTWIQTSLCAWLLPGDSPLCSSLKREEHRRNKFLPVPIYFTWVECGKCRFMSCQRTFVPGRDSNRVPFDRQSATVPLDHNTSTILSTDTALKENYVYSPIFQYMDMCFYQFVQNMNICNF